MFQVISTPPSRVVGSDICSSQEFQTALSSSFADRSSRRRDEKNAKEREEQRQEIESRFISNGDIEKEREKKKEMRLPHRQQPHSFVFSIDRINCYDRYQHIRNIKTRSGCHLLCYSRIDTLGYVSFQEFLFERKGSLIFL